MSLFRKLLIWFISLLLASSASAVVWRAWYIPPILEIELDSQHRPLRIETKSALIPGKSVLNGELWTYDWDRKMVRKQFYSMGHLLGESYNFIQDPALF